MARPYRDINPGTTGVVAQKTPGRIDGGLVTNVASAARYLKLYDTASVPDQTFTPILTLPVLATSGFTLSSAGQGIQFAKGLAYRVTTGVADGDTGAPSANDVILNVWLS